MPRVGLCWLVRRLSHKRRVESCVVECNMLKLLLFIKCPEASQWFRIAENDGLDNGMPVL